MIAPLARLTVVALVLALFTCSHAAALDVEPWDRVLRAHAHQGGIDYRALKDDATARADLRAFIAHVATMDEDEPLSSWLNAYNALVVSSIVERYPLASVRDVPGFFDRVRHRVAGAERTLDDVENRISPFGDARVHAALNCGARSCPPMPARAFRERGLSAALDRAMQGMVRSRAHVRFENGRLRLNEIFFWYDAELRRDAGSVRAFLDRHDESRRLADVPRDAPLERIRYDWRLNDRPRAR
jgi:hypothetical protein